MDPYSVNPISSDNEPASRMASVVAGGTEQDQRFEIGRRIEGQIEGLSRACTATDDGHDRSAEIHATPTDLRAAQDLEKTCDGLQDPPRDACLRRSEPGADTQETLPATVLSATESSNIVDWDGPDDPESPLNWSPTRKWTTIVLVSSITFNVAMASTIFATGVPQAMAEFHVDSPAIASLLISVFIIGLAVGPLVFSPMSEAYGRKPVMLVSNAGFLIATALCAVSTNLPMLIAFRLMMGLACCIPITLGGGFVADLMPLERRGAALSMWAIGPWLGPVVGPAAGGYLSRNVNWRWTFWLVLILSSILCAGTLLILKETYGPRLLERKAARLRAHTHNPHLRSKYDARLPPRRRLCLAVMRPAKLLATSPIVALLSFHAAIVYGYMYLLFATLAATFTSVYGFDEGAAGLAYLGLGIGLLAGQASVGLFSDWYIRRQRARRRGVAKPEDRLPPMVAGTVLVAVGLVWYGWSAERRAHWIVPILGTVLVGLGILYVFLPVQLYFIDTFTVFAVSALAANAVMRSVLGTTIPLAGPALYARLGLGWGNTLLGFLVLAFAPLAVLLLRHGEKIRTNPKFQPSL